MKNKNITEYFGFETRKEFEEAVVKAVKESNELQLALSKPDVSQGENLNYGNKRSLKSEADCKPDVRKELNKYLDEVPMTINEPKMPNCKPLKEKEYSICKCHKPGYSCTGCELGTGCEEWHAYSMGKGKCVIAGHTDCQPPSPHVNPECTGKDCSHGELPSPIRGECNHKTSMCECDLTSPQPQSEDCDCFRCYGTADCDSSAFGGKDYCDNCRGKAKPSWQLKICERLKIHNCTGRCGDYIIDLLKSQREEEQKKSEAICEMATKSAVESYQKEIVGILKDQRDKHSLHTMCQVDEYLEDVLAILEQEKE